MKTTLNKNILTLKAAGFSSGQQKTRKTPRFFKNYLNSLLGNSELDAETMYRACLDAASSQEWQTKCKLKGDWKTHHMLCTTYAWMVHRRLFEDGKWVSKHMREHFFDQYWTDTTIRLRNFGFKEIFINKNLRIVTNSSLHVMTGYDKALELSTEDEKLRKMDEVIWSALCDPLELPDDQLRRLSCHFLAELDTLRNIPTEPIVHGFFEFAVPPDLDAPMIGNRIELRYEKAPLELGEWRQNLDIRGQVYYWNLKTLETTYADPSGEKAKAIEPEKEKKIML